MEELRIEFVGENTVINWQGLLQFGKDEYCHTFGHLYTSEQLSTYLEESYNMDLYLGWVRRPTEFALFVASDSNGDICGFCLCGVGTSLPVPSDLQFDAATFGEIKRIYVSRPQSGRGLAAQLMQRAMRWLEESGRVSPDNVFLGVYSGNSPARRFYEKCGFQEISRYPYPTINVEMLLMRYKNH